MEGRNRKIILAVAGIVGGKGNVLVLLSSYTKGTNVARVRFKFAAILPFKAVGGDAIGSSPPWLASPSTSKNLKCTPLHPLWIDALPATHYLASPVRIVSNSKEQ